MAAPSAATGASTALTCRYCKAGFVFKADQRRFFAKKGFPNPTLCPPCRGVRKKEGFRLVGWPYCKLNLMHMVSGTSRALVETEKL
jgi:hypothetical protein